MVLFSSISNISFLAKSMDLPPRVHSLHSYSQALLFVNSNSPKTFFFMMAPRPFLSSANEIIRNAEPYLEIHFQWSETIAWRCESWAHKLPKHLGVAKMGSSFRGVCLKHEWCARSSNHPTHYSEHKSNDFKFWKRLSDPSIKVTIIPTVEDKRPADFLFAASEPSSSVTLPFCAFVDNQA